MRLLAVRRFGLAVFGRNDPDTSLQMDISRDEQRVLHALAQGGLLKLLKDARGHAIGVECYTRDGWRMAGADLLIFRKLKRKKAIKSINSGPYRITRRGLELVRSQVDNR